jgi:hypothetical protein
MRRGEAHGVGPPTSIWPRQGREPKGFLKNPFQRRSIHHLVATTGQIVGRSCTDIGKSMGSIYFFGAVAHRSIPFKLGAAARQETGRQGPADKFFAAEKRDGRQRPSQALLRSGVTLPSASRPSTIAATCAPHAFNAARFSSDHVWR